MQELEWQNSNFQQVQQASAGYCPEELRGPANHDPNEHSQQTQPGVSPGQSKRWMRCSGTTRTPGSAEAAARTQHEDSKHGHSFLSYLREGLKLFRSSEIQNIQSILTNQKQQQHFWYRPEEQIAWNLDFAHYPQYSPWSDPDLLRIIVNEWRLLIFFFFCSWDRHRGVSGCVLLESHRRYTFPVFGGKSLRFSFQSKKGTELCFQEKKNHTHP